MVTVTIQTQKLGNWFLWPRFLWAPGPCLLNTFSGVSKVSQNQLVQNKLMIFTPPSCHSLPTSPIGKEWRRRTLLHSFSCQLMSVAFICLCRVSGLASPSPTFLSLHIRSTPGLGHLTSWVACTSGHLLLPGLLELPHSWSFHICPGTSPVHQWFKDAEF